MTFKVGIVILSHNASQAVRITLASLRQAKNETSAKVVLVDNASFDIERATIRSAFDRHVREGALPWNYIQLEQNKGFSGGNNIGIQYLLDDPSITHICLLNSDVIVTDHWLDYLIDTNCDFVSTVTNRSESEQVIPIDYTISPDECLDEQEEKIRDFARSRVNRFAQDRHQAWAGNLVEGEATFFCVLLKKQLIEEVGLLDETFFPGGYEDDDFCIRARQHGYEIHIARDVFIHHWGSASFGQIPREYFKENASRNLKYLEDKHGVVRRRRSEKPFLSFLQDVKFASVQKGTQTQKGRYHSLYVAQLSSLLKHFESEFENLHILVMNSNQVIPTSLQSMVDQAMSRKDLTTTWKAIVTRTEHIFNGIHEPKRLEGVLADLEYIIEGIWERVECNFAMHDFVSEFHSNQVLDKNNLDREMNPSSLFQRTLKIFQFFIRGLRFLWKLKGIVFFGGYPYPERQSDGYFQRIQMVDRLFTDRWRIYIESGYIPGRNHWIDIPEGKVLVLRITGRLYQRAAAQILGLVSILKCRKVYFHSILTMRHKHIAWLLQIPGLMKVVDIHGVVTEEFRLHNDFYNAMLYEHVEQLAVRRCDLIVVVTKAMENYLRNKYRDKLHNRILTFPMFPNYPTVIKPRTYIDGKPVIVYAGGLQRWQQVPKMINAIRNTVSQFNYRFYCPDPSQAHALLPERIRSHVLIDHKTREELFDVYSECHYGFILREDNIVNHVACPTKLVEYLAMGIVPIVDSENIGDFKEMGMQTVTLDALLNDSLPDEHRRAKMAESNTVVYERLREVYKQGAYDLWALISNRVPIRNENLLLRWARELLPPNTRRGHLARLPWMKFKSIKKNLFGSKTPETGIPIPTYECDILIQVHNFEAGGLEKIVLDINDELLDSGYKLVLLVLGISGEGIEKARELGIRVVHGSPENEWLEPFIEHTMPRLVLSHYSIDGAELYHRLGIPFVQVVQNAYMWFDNNELAAFKKAASFTTLFIALSEYARQYSISRLGVDENQCVVLPCGINLQTFDITRNIQTRQNLRSQHGFKDGDFIFLSMGSINHQKNHIATVRAFAAQSSKFPNAKLLIIGPGYEKDLLNEILTFIEKNNLTDRIVYAGSTPEPEKYYALADAFVSSAFFEGGPLILLESIKANLPVIMTNVGLACHFIGLEGMNIIEPPIDISKFQGAIWQLSSTKVFEDQLAEAMWNVYESSQRPNLPEHILREFDKTSTYKRYVKLIEDLMRGDEIDRSAYRNTWVDVVEKFLIAGNEKSSEER